MGVSRPHGSAGWRPIGDQGSHLQGLSRKAYLRCVGSRDDLAHPRAGILTPEAFLRIWSPLHVGMLRGGSDVELERGETEHV